MKKISTILLSLGVYFVALGPFAEAAKLYKWVDEKGVIHFSDRLPESPEKVKGILEEKDIPESPAPEVKPQSKPPSSARSPIEHAVNCTFLIKSPRKVGTGFLITTDGYAATCRHVMEEGLNQVAVLNDQSEVPIQLVGVSHKHDLALVQVLMPDRASHLSMRDAGTLVPGERLFAIGSSAGLQATVTDGVFTGFRKIVDTGERLVQFSAPINQGNSGGPLVDEQGRVVGVVTLKYIMRNGVPVSGVGFAV
ncbi:MAG: trypsin-like peptidase domain-containing protein, partial [Deltaproteobacteria bacterium]|nr:trypsin-like peptidase domain-containing protein [Deltaproteobacteria bacterium]